MDTQIILFLLVLGGLLLAGVVTTKLASRMGVPALILFILVGMVLGSDISGLIYFDDAWLAQLVGTMALVVILFEGGLHSRWSQLKKVSAPALSLATLGVGLTVLGVGLIAWLVLGFDPAYAMLLGAIVGSTDAAAVFAVIGNQNISQRIKSTLEAESGVNDPMAVFLTLMMMDWIQAGPPGLWEALGFLVWQMGLGILLGLAFGKIAAWGLPRLRFQSGGLYPILLFAIAIFAFAASSWLHGSGFVTVYVLAVFLGGLELPYRQSILRFHEGMAWLAQMVMFILLGLLVFPRQLPAVVLSGLVIAVGLMLIARPLAVWLSTIGMGFSRNERLLIAWAGLRGAVPIVLATYPMLAGLPMSHEIFNVVFFVVLTSALIQGASIAKVSSWLGLVRGTAAPRVVTMELVTMDMLDTDLLEIAVPEGAPVVNRPLSELAMPQHSTVSALLRAGRVITPRGHTRLLAGDVLFILARKDAAGSIRTLFSPEADD